MIKTAGKQFRNEGNLFFIASNVGTLTDCIGYNNQMLLAVNEITDAHFDLLRDIIARDILLFIDSGVFNLTNEHARKNGCSMDEALALPPNKIDGYDELFERYLKVCKSIGEDSWGYIEIDQGGCDEKIKTRKDLESRGLRPIPVYHPLNDGWDYFDYLAERYDRICVGNLVQASRESRKKILATIYVRRQKYPDLWVHALGVTYSDLTHSCPPSSSDSSAWLAPMRWADSAGEFACGKAFRPFDNGFFYRYDVTNDSEKGIIKARRLQGAQAEMNGRNWSRYVKRLQEVSV